MTLRQRPATTLRLQAKPILLFLTGCGVFAFIISLLTANVATTEEAHAAAPYETMDSGSYIINMGIVPQTYANGLKPYGMVYDLIRNYNTQVKWVIDTAKAKDAKDDVKRIVNNSVGEKE